MGEALTGLAAVIGAAGTVLTAYLAYKIRVVTKNTDGTLTELREENLALGEQVTALLQDKAAGE